jgi:quercetin dioxygenase-like cupin family protein
MKAVPYNRVPEKKVDDPEARDVFMRVVIGPEDGAGYFRVRPGGHTPHHAHPWEHENYVLAGRGEVMTPDGPRAVGPGDVVFIEAGMKHQYRNTGDTDFEFLCLIPAVNP